MQNNANALRLNSPHVPQLPHVDLAMAALGPWAYYHVDRLRAMSTLHNLKFDHIVFT